MEERHDLILAFDLGLAFVALLFYVFEFSKKASPCLFIQSLFRFFQIKIRIEYTVATHLKATVELRATLETIYCIKIQVYLAKLS